MTRRPATRLPILGLAAALALAPATRADELVDDDRIVTGNTCAGFDCVNGETFNGTSLKLKENNLRLRLIDTTASGMPGASWSLIANESSNDGAAFFSLALQPIDTDSAASDDPPPTHVLRTGVAAANSTAIGPDSEVVDGAVTLGNAGTLRRLVRVAEALADTQAVIRRQLDAGGLGGRAGVVDTLEARVSALEDEVTRLESTAGNGEGDDGDLVFGGAIRPLGLLLLAGLVGVARVSRSPRWSS